MKIGIDTFTLRELKLDPFETLDFVRERHLEGVQFGGLRSLSRTLDSGELEEVRARADELGLYSHVSIPTCNPHLVKGPLEDHFDDLSRHIESAAACGWHELHTALGGGPERYEHPVPWTQHLEDSADVIRRLGPILREHGSRIDVETHGDVTTFELVRLIEDVGEAIAGICLDTANLLCQAEDPVPAVRRAAPYTHLTHIKDAIIYFKDFGYQRQGKTPGQGVLEWESILTSLAEYSPDLTLSIEDHKWLFDFQIFDERWLSLHPDLTREELMKVVQIAWECQKKISSGEWPDPQQYEDIPYLDQMDERLNFGRDFLASLLDRLDLR
jgi:sugar phosphate isomerase/epimerase